MNRKILLFCFALFILSMSACKDDDGYTNEQLAGLWLQEQITIDGIEKTLDRGEKVTSIFIEPNGVYRLFDGIKNKEHFGTWILTDSDWLTLSLDRIFGKEADGTSRYEPFMARFTILHMDDETLEIRMRTTLGKRKTTIMFNEMEADQPTMSEEDRLELDTRNKTMHTYIYKFKKVKL